MRHKYPPIEPYRTGFLTVPGHQLYWKESGNPMAGFDFSPWRPGSGTEPGHRCYFDPKIYRICLMDQRGCGKSTPHSSLKENTTWHLVSDIETLKEHLKIEKWVVFGGSWGSTLALAYEKHIQTLVLALVLRRYFPRQAQKSSDGFINLVYDLFVTSGRNISSQSPLPNGRSHPSLLPAAHFGGSCDQAKGRLRLVKLEGSFRQLIFDPTLFRQFTADAHADALALLSRMPLF